MNIAGQLAIKIHEPVHLCPQRITTQESFQKLIKRRLVGYPKSVPVSLIANDILVPGKRASVGITNNRKDLTVPEFAAGWIDICLWIWPFLDQPLGKFRKI